MMYAGMGKFELTPPMGVELAGYGYYLGRRAAQVLDPLYARALYLETDDDRLLLISCEVLGLSGDIVKAVREGLAQRGFAEAQAMIVSIHTHTGPALKYHEGCGYVDEAFHDTVAEKILRACENAVNDKQAVTSLQGALSKIEPGFAYNRARKDGPADDMVRGFRFERGAHPPIAVCAYACHPVSRGRVSGVSADYPGAVNRLLEADGARAMYINGLCGDIDPAVPEDADRNARMNDFARAIHQAFSRNLAPLPCTLSAGRLSCALALQPVTREAIRAAANGAVARAGGEEQGAARVARIWEREMLQKFDRLAFAENIRVSYAKIGGRLLLALPFEGFTQIGLTIRERLRAPEAIILGCAEELLGYLPTKDDIARGAYAALESTFLYKRLPVLPGAAEALSDDLSRALAETAARKDP